MPDLTKPMHIICFATFFKGGDFMRECKTQGGRITLVTKEKMLSEDWPRDVLDEVFALPNDAPVELFLDLVAQKYHAVFERGGLDQLQVLLILENARSLAA